MSSNAPLPKSAWQRVWWADRLLAPTLIVEPVTLGNGDDRVVLGDVDAPFLLTMEEAHEIGSALIAAAGAVRVLSTAFSTGVDHG